MMLLPAHLVEHLDFLARLDKIPVIDRAAERRARLDALDAANHARDLEIEHHDGSWRDRN